MIGPPIGGLSLQKPPVESLLLQSGSLCLMAPGMQDTHEHRIPKVGAIVGERISLVFRGYVEPPATAEGAIT